MASNDKTVSRSARKRRDPAIPGETGDFEHLFERFYRPVSYFFANRGFSDDECRDLTQETFLGVYRGIGRFRRDASVETWLFTIAGNIWRNALRSRSAEKRDAKEVSLAALIDDGEQIVGDPAADAGAGGPLDDALTSERLRCLREAMAELPPQMRRCMLLRVDQDMKYREIAAVLQISVDTVKSQLFQARERLKTRLAAHFAELEL